MKIMSILVDCGWLLYDIRDDARLFVLMNHLLAYLGLDRRKIEKRWLTIYELTVQNLVNYRKVKETVSLLKQVVKIEEQRLTEDHPDRLASQYTLAEVYRANGQVKETMSCLLMMGLGPFQYRAHRYRNSFGITKDTIRNANMKEALAEDLAFREDLIQLKSLTHR